MPPSWHTDYYQSNSVQHYITRAHCYRQFSYQTVISNKLTCHCKIFTIILTLCVSGSSTKQPKLWACFLFAWGIKKHNLYLSDIFLYWISFSLLNRLKSNINSEVSLVKSKGGGFSLSLKSRQLGCKSRWLGNQKYRRQFEAFTPLLDPLSHNSRQLRPQSTGSWFFNENPEGT